MTNVTAHVTKIAAINLHRSLSESLLVLNVGLNAGLNAFYFGIATTNMNYFESLQLAREFIFDSFGLLSYRIMPQFSYLDNAPPTALDID